MNENPCQIQYDEGYQDGYEAGKAELEAEVERLKRWQEIAKELEPFLSKDIDKILEGDTAGGE